MKTYHKLSVLVLLLLILPLGEALAQMEVHYIEYGFATEQPSYMPLANGDSLVVALYHFYAIGQNPESEDATQTCTSHELVRDGKPLRTFGACTRIYLSGDTHQYVWYTQEPGLWTPGSTASNRWHTISGTGKYEDVRCEGEGGPLLAITRPWRSGLEVVNNRWTNELRGTCVQE